MKKRILLSIAKHYTACYRIPFFWNQEDESIKPYNIRLLQMAVRLFEKNKNINPVLDRLKDECNLLFIDYLSNTCALLDDKEEASGIVVGRIQEFEDRRVIEKSHVSTLQS